MAILALLSYYARHNLPFTWKQSPPTMYVISCLQHAVTACKGVGSSLKTAPQDRNNSNSSRRRLDNIEIKQTGLISTTNYDTIIRSNTINKKPNCDISAEANATSFEARPNILPKPNSEKHISIKNIKHLKLKTNFRFSKNTEDIESPQTSETYCGDTPLVSVRDLAKKINVRQSSPSSIV